MFMIVGKKCDYNPKWYFVYNGNIWLKRGLKSYIVDGFLGFRGGFSAYPLYQGGINVKN
ncbi:hypothetical protein [Helicobacter valdiviensis]|uniref:hypothetical protein n=1 Tax=Helicobacter valdiviensis TaxID=1458358 RepID=UPI0015EC682C|nr:hypothetical protein [Helicobacter valdiviensis]